MAKKKIGLLQETIIWTSYPSIISIDTGTTDPSVECFCQSNCFKNYHKLPWTSRLEALINRFKKKPTIHTWFIGLIYELFEKWKNNVRGHHKETLPKAQRTKGLSSGYQNNFYRSYQKFSNKSWLDFIFIISTKQQLQNLKQISAFLLREALKKLFFFRNNS